MQLAISIKGGLISENFTLWLQSPKKVPNHSPQQLLFKSKSEIKLPLVQATKFTFGLAQSCDFKVYETKQKNQFRLFY